MRVAIVGGSGSIGRRLYRRLAGNGGHELRVLDVERHAEIAAGDFRHLDVTDGATVAGSLAGVEVVFYKTGLMGPAASFEAPQRFHALNLEGALRLHQEAQAAGVRHFVYDSTECVFGRDNRPPFDEHERPAPDSVYGATKAACEHYLRLAAATRGMQITILRYPRVVAADNATIFSALRDRIRQGQEILLTARGEKRFDIVHIDDVVDWNAALLGATESRTLHVTGGFTVSAVEVLRGLAARLTGSGDYPRTRVSDERTCNDRLNPDLMCLANEHSRDATGLAVRHTRLEPFLELF